MRELERKRRVRKWMYSLPALVLLASIAGLLVHSAWGVYGKQVESARHVRELESQASVLSARKAELEENIRALGTEEGVIDEIKGKFSVTEEGEYVAILVDEPRKATTTEESEESWGARLWRAIESLWQ